MPRARPANERFDEKYIPEPNSGCWLWTASINASKYGTLNRGPFRSALAHRFSYERFVGEVPDELRVCHSCDNTYCVNPDHLFVGTVRDNVYDRIKKGRSNYVHGEKIAAAKLREFEVADILRDRRPIAKIADSYGVHESTIEKVFKGVTWKHIPRDGVMHRSLRAWKRKAAKL